MKILLILTAREVGGAELYVERLVSTLANQCHFTIAISDHPAMRDLSRRISGYATVKQFAFERPQQLPKILVALRNLAKVHDLVHINSNHPASRLGIGVAIAMCGLSTPTITVEHRVTPLDDIQLPPAIAWCLPTLFRWSRKHVKRLVAVSNENAQTLVEYYKIPARKIEVIHNSVDIAAFAQPTQPIEITRQSLGLQPDQPVILVLAKLMPSKGHRYLIDAAPRILSHFPKAHFIFAGTTEEKAVLEKQITKLGLQSHFSLLGFRSDTIDLLHCCNLFVLPSLAEGFALTIIEALAAGIPTIATNVGGASEAILHGRNGFLVPPANVGALHDAILKVLFMDDVEIAQLRNSARESAQRFSLSEMANKTFRVYEQVIGSI